MMYSFLSSLEQNAFARWYSVVLGGSRWFSVVLGTGTILLLTAASMYSNVLLAMLTVSIGVNRYQVHETS